MTAWLHDWCFKNTFKNHIESYWIILIKTSWLYIFVIGVSEILLGMILITTSWLHVFMMDVSEIFEIDVDDIDEWQSGNPVTEQ